MMSCNTPSIDQTNEAVKLSFFSMDIQFFSRLSLICGAWEASINYSNKQYFGTSPHNRTVKNI